MEDKNIALKMVVKFLAEGKDHKSEVCGHNHYYCPTCSEHIMPWFYDFEDWTDSSCCPNCGQLLQDPEESTN